MDEIIVRVARAIACLPRLRILTSLARAEESTPTGLARDLQIPKNVVSTHLRMLSSAGLIQRRRSGVWNYCTAHSPYEESTLSGDVMSWLRGALVARRQGSGRSTGRTLKGARTAEIDTEVHETVFEAATAFTNVRRIQILRLLTSRESVTVRMLTEELRMSEPAVGRHMDKLMRRGYVESGSAGRFLTYELAPSFKTPIHARMFEIVRAQWRTTELRSSRTP